MAGQQVANVNDKQLVQVVEPDIEIVEDTGVGNVEQRREVVVADTERAGQYEHVNEDTREGNREDGRALATTGETPEQLSARQRRRRADRAVRDRERQELATLRNENAQLKQIALSTDQRVARVEISTVDSQIAVLEAEIGRANSVISRAITAANGEDAQTAMEIRDTLRDRLNGLKADKAKQLESRQQVVAQPVQQAQLPPGVTPAQVSNFNIFLKRHDWYDPQWGDADSLKVKAIDKELQDEGSDPNMASHWQELENRVREALPHRFQAVAADGGSKTGEQPNKRPNGSGGPRLPGSGAGSGGGAGGKVTFHLSAARKQALIDLGVYGTPDQTKYIKNFMAWDAANPGTKQ